MKLAVSAVAFAVVAAFSFGCNEKPASSTAPAQPTAQPAAQPAAPAATAPAAPTEVKVEAPKVEVK